jgi:hypothetical protein
MINVQTFIGEAPRVSPRLLPDTAAQSAVNCRMETGDVLAWRQFVSEKVLAAAATTIYKLNGSWLSWNADVDVARGPIPGDTNYFTFLTAPSLYATPRYTTFPLATTGAEPYPVETRPVGMPSPTVAPHGPSGVGTAPAIGVDSTPTATVSIDITDAGNQLSTWVTSPTQNPHLGLSTVFEDAVVGNPTPAYTLVCDRGSGGTSFPAYMYKDFGISRSAVIRYVVDFRMHGAVDSDRRYMNVHIANEVDGNGLTVYYDSLSPGLNIGTSAAGWQRASVSSFAAGSVGVLAEDFWYRLEVDVVAGEVSQSVTAKVFNGSTELGAVTATNSWKIDGYCGHVFHVFDDSSIEDSRTTYDNVRVTASGARGLVITNQATSYVYTFVNNNVGGAGVIWQSAPSPASITILRPDGVGVSVTTATSHAFDAGYGINRKYIYRSITGATGTAFFLVADIPLATANYVDDFDDQDISNPGVVLPSEDWDLPPAGLKGIIALPNGSMCGFFANQLCFSEPARPHAWPVGYRMTTETDIVAIANIDNTVVIGQAGPLQVATGNIPGSYSMSKPGEPQACVSKKSMRYVDGFGVVYASPDGFQVCAGSAGNVKNATADIFTKQQWESLTPSSIISAVYDGNLFWWFTGSTPDAGYMLDTKPGGAGLVSLAHHAVAAHVDLLTDSLFLILDQNNEPIEATLPVASTAVAASATTVYRFDAHATDRIRYLWRGKLNLMPHETTFHFAKVEAEDFTNLALRVYGDGALIYTVRVTSAAPFRIPGLTVYSTYELALVGTSRARTAQLAQHIEEFY